MVWWSTQVCNCFSSGFTRIHKLKFGMGLSGNMNSEFQQSVPLNGVWGRGGGIFTTPNRKFWIPKLPPLPHFLNGRGLIQCAQVSCLPAELHSKIYHSSSRGSTTQTISHISRRGESIHIKAVDPTGTVGNLLSLMCMCVWWRWIVWVAG